MSDPIDVAAVLGKLEDPACGGLAVFLGTVRNDTHGRRVRHRPAARKEPPTRRRDRPRPLAVSPSTSIRACIDLMVKHAMGCVLVTEGASLQGIFTERDVLKRVVAAGVDPATTPVSTVMT